MDKWCELTDPYDNMRYYYRFTAEEINIMSENGLWCWYVGSGQGRADEADWNTPQGINIWCELSGDSLVAEENSVYYENSIWNEYILE